jgi:hypothetical protein
MARLYVRAGHLTAQNGGFGHGQGDSESTNPCQNGGVCHAVVDSDDCKTGRDGNNVDACHTCSCAPFTFGHNCEQLDSKDDCKASACCDTGTAQCIDMFQNAMCVCKPGFTGADCATDSAGHAATCGGPSAAVAAAAIARGVSHCDTSAGTDVFLVDDVVCVGLGRIVALHQSSSALYQKH